MKKKTLLAVLVATTMSFALAGCSKDTSDNTTIPSIESVSISNTESSTAISDPSTEEVKSSEESTSEAATTESESASEQTSTDTVEAGKELYEAFKSGTEKLYIQTAPISPEADLSYGPTYDSPEGYTLDELTAVVKEGYEQSNDKLDVAFSYLDCGNDGTPELALEFTGLGIYSKDDGSTLVFIIKESGGKLYSYYNFETWARSDTEINENGVISSFGSGGAAEHGGFEGFIDPTGHFKEIYYTWESGIEASDTTYSAYVTLTIGDTTREYFCTDDESIPEDALAQFVEFRGLENVDQIPTVTTEELNKQMDELIDNAFTQNGVTKEMRDAKKLFR